MLIPETNRPLSIVLAIDGSEHSLAALHLLRDLHIPAGSTITVLAAFLPRNASNYNDHLRNVQHAAQELEERGWEIIREVVSGSPAEVITQKAAQAHADLIVLGARGLRSTLGILLGGVAQQVVEYSTRPVLVVRAPYTGLQHALIVIDGSPCSQYALDYAGQFPLPAQVQLDVMYVLPPPPMPQPMLVAYTWPVGYGQEEAVQEAHEEEIRQMLEQEESDGRALLASTVENLQNTLQKRGFTCSVHSELRRGDAATEIIEYARELQVDIIFAGSRGLGAIKGWLLGSVSRKLVHYAGCSVLVVRRTETGNTLPS